MSKFQDELNKRIKSPLEDGANAAIDPRMGVPEPSQSNIKRPELAFEKPDTAGGLSVDNVMSNYRQNLEDEYSKADETKVPQTYSPYVVDYNRKQELQSRYDKTMSIEDPDERELNYKMLLMDTYGYDILSAKGHDVTSSAYWYKKFKNLDYSNPMYNQYIMDSALYEAEYMLSQYEIFKLNHDFNAQDSITRIADMYNQEITEEMYPEIQLQLPKDHVAQTLTYEEFMTQLTSGMMDAQSRGIYEYDDETDTSVLKSFMHEDGKTYEVMTEAEYKNNKPGYDVFVLQEDGDLVLNDKTGVGQVIGNFGRGLVRSGYDLYQMVRMLGAGALAWFDNNPDTTFGSQMVKVYQETEAFANEFKGIGRDTVINMDGSKGLFQNETWYGVGGFVGQIGGAIAAGLLTGGMSGIGTALAKSGSKAGQELVEQTVKTGVKESLEASLRTVSTSLVSELGEEITEESVKKAFRTSLKEMLEEGVQTMSGRLGVKLSTEVGDEAIDSAVEAMAKRIMVNGVKEVTDEGAEQLLREYGEALVKEQAVDVIKRTFVNDSVEAAMVGMSDDLTALISKGLTNSNVDDFLDDMFKKVFESNGGQFLDFFDEATIKGFKKDWRMAMLRSKRQNSADDVLETLVTKMRNDMMEQAAMSAAGRELIEKGITEGIEATTKKALAANWLKRTTGRGIKMMGQTVGRIHGVYMGNPLGSEVSMTTAAILAKRGSFALAYSTRDALSTYAQLRTVGVDEEEAAKSAWKVMGINTAVTFLFTGGIDDSVTMDYYKVLNNGNWLKKVPATWTQGDLGKGAFRKLLFADVASDTFENIVTMSTDAYFKNPDREEGFAGWLQNLGDTISDPEMLLSVFAMSSMGAVGARRSHQAGFDLPAKAFDKMRTEFTNRATDVRESAERRAVFAEVDRQAQKKFKGYLDQKMEAGEAMIRTMEDIHQMMKDPKTGWSIIKDVMDSTADEERIAMQKVLYNQSVKVINDIKANRRNMVSDILHNGFPNALLNRIQKFKSTTGETSVSRRRLDSTLAYINSVSDKYRYNIDDADLSRKFINDMFDREFEAYDVKETTKASVEDTLKKDVSILGVASKQGKDILDSITDIPEQDKGNYQVIRFALEEPNRTPIYHAIQHSLKLLSGIYKRVVPTGLPAFREVDGGKGLYILRVANEAKAITAVTQLHMMAQSMVILSDTTQTVKSRTKALKNLSALMNPEMPNEVVYTKKAFLHTLNSLVSGNFMDMDVAVSLLRMVDPNTKAYGEPTNTLVRYLHLVDTMERAEVLPAGDRRRLSLEKEASEILKLMQPVLPSEQSKVLSAQLVKIIDASKNAPSAERLLRSSSEQTIDHLLKILDLTRKNNLSEDEAKEVLRYVWDNFNDSTENIEKIKAAAKNPRELVLYLKKAGYLTEAKAKEFADSFQRYSTKTLDHKANIDRFDFMFKTVKELVSEMGLDSSKLYEGQLKTLEVVMSKYASDSNTFKDIDERFTNVIYMLGEEVESYTDENGDPQVRTRLVNNGFTVSEYLDNVLKLFDEDYIEERTRQHQEAVDRYGYLNEDLRAFTGEDDDAKLQVLPYYWDEKTDGKLADYIKDNSLAEAVEHVLETRVPSESERVDRAFADIEGSLEMLNLDTDVKFKQLMEDRTKIDTYFSKGVKNVKNSGTRIIVDLNRILPKTFKQIADILETDSGTLIKTLRSSDKGDMIGLLKFLKERTDVPWDVEKSLLDQHEAYQQLLRLNTGEDGVLTFDMFDRKNSYETLNSLMSQLGYFPEDYTVDSQVVNIPGFVKLSTDVASIVGTVNQVPGRFGVKTSDDNHYNHFDRSLFRDTQGTMYMDRNTVVSPGLLARIGKVNTGVRRIADYTNRRFTTALSKAAKAASKAGSEVTHTGKGTGFETTYKPELIRFEMLTSLIDEFDQAKPYSAIPTDTVPTHRFTFVDPADGKRKAIWTTADENQLIDGEDITFIHAFDKDAAEAYIKKQQTTGDDIALDMIVPPTLQAVSSTVMDTYLNKAKASGSMPEFKDRTYNSATPTIQDVVSEFPNKYSANNDWKIEKPAGNQFDVLTGDIDTKALQFSDEDFDMNSVSGMTLGQIVDNFKNAPTDSKKYQLFKYAEAALAKSNEVYKPLENTNDAVKVFLGHEGLRNVYLANRNKSDAELVTILNKFIQDENNEKLNLEERGIDNRLIGQTLDPTLRQGDSRVLTSDYISNLNPIYNQRLTEADIQSIRQIESNIAEGKTLNGSKDYNVPNKRLVVDEDTDAFKQSKLLSYLRAVDQDDYTSKKRNIPLALIEQLTDEEYQYLKDNEILDKATLKLIAEKMDILNEFKVDRPQGVGGLLGYRQGSRDFAREVSNQTIGEGKAVSRRGGTEYLPDKAEALTELVRNKARLKDFTSLQRNIKEGGFEKVRKLFDNYGDKSNYARAYLNYLSDEVLHTVDKPQAYMAINEHNRIQAARRAATLTDIAAILKENSPEADMKVIAKTANDLYARSTGVKYMGEYTRYAVVDKHGKMIDSAAYVRGNMGNETKSLFAMLLSNDYKPEDAPMIYILDKDKFTHEGNTTMKAIKLYDDEGKPTADYNTLREHAQADIARFLVNYRATEGEDGEVNNIYRRWLGMTASERKAVDPLTKEKLEMAVMSYITGAQGYTKTWQDNLAHVAKNIFTDSTNPDKLVKSLIGLIHGDKRTLTSAIGEFDDNTQAILRTVDLDKLKHQVDDIYRAKLNSNTRLKAISDLILFGSGADDLSFDSLKLFRGTQRKLSSDSGMQFLTNSGISDFAELLPARTKKDLKTSTRNLSRQINDYVNTLLALESVKYADIPSKLKEKEALVAKINSAIGQIVKRSKNTLDTYTIKQEVVKYIYKKYLSSSTSPAAVRFFTDKDMTLTKLNSYLLGESDFESLEVMPGVTLAEALRPGADHHSFDVESVPTADGKQLIFQVGFMKGTYGEDFSAKASEFKEYFVFNDELLKKYHENDPYVMQFIRDREGTAWHKSFTKWLNADKVQWTEVDSFIKGIDSLNLISANGKEFDIKHLANYLDDSSMSKLTSSQHIDITNDLSGLMSLATNSTNIKLDDYVRLNPDIKEKIDADYKRLMGKDYDKNAQSHDAVYDSVAAMHVAGDIMYKGLKINENKSGVRKPLLSIEDDLLKTDGKLTEADLRQLDDELSDYKYVDEDGVIHSGGSFEDIAQIVTVMNDIKKYQDTQQRYKLNRVDSAKLPTILSKRNDLSLSEGNWRNFYRLMSVMGAQLAGKHVNEQVSLFHDGLYQGIIDYYNTDLKPAGANDRTSLSLNEVLKVILDDASYNDRFFNILEERMGLKIPGDVETNPSLRFEMINDNDLNHNDMARVFTNIFNDETEAGTRKALNLRKYSSLVSPIKGLFSMMKTPSNAMKDLLVPLNINEDFVQNPDKLSTQTRINVSRTALDRTLDRILKAEKNTMRNGVKVTDTAYMLTVNNVNVLPAYSTFIGDGVDHRTAIPGDVILTPKAFEQLYSKPAKAGDTGYVSVIRQPSDNPDSFTVLRYFITDTEMKDSTKSMIVNPTTYKMLQGDFDGDHTVIFAGRNDMSDMMAVVHKAQHSISPVMDSIINKHVTTLDAEKLYGDILTITAEDFVKVMNGEELPDVTGDPLRDNDLYKGVIKSAQEVMSEYDLGELSYVQGEGIKTQSINMLDADTDPELRAKYNSYLANYQHIFGLRGKHVASQTGWMQMQSVLRSMSDPTKLDKDNKLKDIVIKDTDNPLAMFSTRDITLDDTDRLRWTTVYDASDDPTKLAMIEDFNQTLRDEGAKLDITLTTGIEYIPGRSGSLVMDEMISYINNFLGVGYKYNEEANAEFRKVLTESEFEGMASEIFTAKEIKDMLHGTFKDYIETRKEITSVGTATSAYRSKLLDDITQNILAEMVDQNRGNEEAVKDISYFTLSDGTSKPTGRKAKVLFSAKHLQENTALVSDTFAKSTFMHTGKAVKVTEPVATIKVGSRVDEGERIGINGETSPIKGTVKLIDGDNLIIVNSTPLNQSMKLGDTSGSSVLKFTLAGQEDMLGADIVLSVTDLENINKVSPLFLNKFVQSVTSTGELSYEMDVQILEAYLHSKNYNENFDVNLSGGQVEGGKIDFLTMIMNSYSAAAPLLYGSDIIGTRGKDILYKQGLIPYEEYVKDSQQEYLHRNKLPDLHATRLQLIGMLTTDEQFNKISSVSREEWNTYWDRSGLVAMDTINAVENWISRQLNFKDGDFSELITDSLASKMRMSADSKALQYKLKMFKRLLSSEIVQLGRNTVVSQLDYANKEELTTGRKITPKDVKQVRTVGDIFTDVAYDEMVITGKADLTKANFLNWRDMMNYLIQDDETHLSYLPSDKDLMSWTKAGLIGYGKGKEGILATNFQPINSDFVSDVESTFGGTHKSLKTGTTSSHLIQSEALKSALSVDDFRTQFKELDSKVTRNINPDPTPIGKVDNAAGLRLFMRSLFRSVESDPLLLAEDYVTKLNMGMMREELNSTLRKDFTEKLPLINMKAVFEDGNLGYKAVTDEVDVRPSDAKELNKKSYSGTTYNLYRDRVRSTDVILEAYNKVTSLTDTEVTALFNKIREDKQKLLEIPAVDSVKFMEDFREVKNLLELTILEGRVDILDDPTLSTTPRSALNDMRHKTINDPIDTGEQWKKDVIKINQLTASGISDATKRGTEIGSVVNQYSIDFHNAFDSLASDMLTLKHMVKVQGGMDKFHQYNLFKQLLGYTKQNNTINSELITKYAGNILGLTDVKDMVNAMLAYTEAYERGSNKVIVDMMNGITDKVIAEAQKFMDVPHDIRYMIKNPLSFKSLTTAEKQAEYISLVSAMFNPKKYSLEHTTNRPEALVGDPFDSLASVIKDISKVSALHNLADNATKANLKENASIMDIARSYVSTYMKENDSVTKDDAIKAVMTMFDDPHVGRYIINMKDEILGDVDDVDFKLAGKTIIENLRNTLSDVETSVRLQIKAAFTAVEAKNLKLIESSRIKDLTNLYGKVTNPIVKEQVLDLINILSVKEQVDGFAFGHLKDDAPSFSVYLQQQLGDAQITDKFLRIISYDDDINMPSMKPIFEKDTSHIYDLLRQGYGQGKSGFEQRLLSMALNGEVYATNAKFAKHLDKFFFTTKTPNRFKKALQTTGLWFNKFVMGNPLRLPERLFRFAAFDIAMTGIQNPKTFFYIAKAGKDMRQNLATKGKVRAPELDQYYKYKGITPTSAKIFDYIGRTEEISTLPGIPGKVQETSLEAIESFSDIVRYANFLANAQDIRDGKISYGAAYKKKDYIDSLPDEWAKASMIYKTNLPTIGDLPLISRRMAPYFVFTSFGLGLTRTALDWSSSAFRQIQDAIIRSDTSGVFRNLMIPGMGVMGMYLASNLYLGLIGDLFGVDDEEVEEWKEDRAFIDWFGTAVYGSPVTRMTSNPIKTIENDWIKPLTEGFKGMDKYDDSDDSWIWSVVSLLNTQLGSKVTPMIKTPMEIITKHDLFGTLPISTKSQYTLWDNVARKLSGVVLGTTAGNSLINNMNMSKYKDDPWVLDFTHSMARAIGDEFGNSRSYKQSVKDFYKARELLYGEIYREDDTAGDDMSDLFNTNYTDQFVDSKYDPDEAKRVGNLLRQVLKAEEDVTLMHKIIYEELQSGTAPSILRSALNKVSVQRLYDRIENKDSFKDSLSDTEWKVLQNALEYEARLFPGLGDMLPYSSYNSNSYSPFNYKIPYNQYTYLPKRYNNYNSYRKPYKGYTHWSDEIQPNMGTADPEYVAPGIDPELGTGKDRY